MSATEWLLWAASIWSSCLLFVLLDLPVLLGRVANRMRRQRLPHWARHGHAQPDEPLVPAHGRHRARSH